MDLLKMRGLKMTREYIWNKFFAYFTCAGEEWRYVEIYLWQKGTISLDLLWMLGILFFLLLLVTVKRRLS
ncbi:MAG: hypothetical protein HFI83_11155 [Eubacterium sp.]|nr:hypothetical protein [Eubacterium sp.]